MDKGNHRPSSHPPPPPPSPRARKNHSDNKSSSSDPGVVERFLTHLFADRLLRPTTDSSPQSATKTSSAANAPPTTPDQEMGTPQDRVFCTEDTVGLKGEKLIVGIVDRTFGDIDTHNPRPQRDYTEDIERHAGVSARDYDRFMWTGIPPRGTVLVSWQSLEKTELVLEESLLLLDRALYVGDVVKRSAKDPMSGTVIATKAFCTVFPSMIFQGGRLTQTLSDDLSIRKVPTQELINVHEYNEGSIVIYKGWIGRITQVFDEITIRLSNNSVVVVEQPDELENEEIMLDRLSVGDVVKTKKGNLRRGRWRYGAFDPNIRPVGTVVETRTVWMQVHWLVRKIGTSEGQDYDEPNEEVLPDDMNSPDFFVYDASASAAIALPLSADGQSLSYHVSEVAVGDRVRFKDLAGAAAKYDGSKTLENGDPQGKLTRVLRNETLGYDLNVYVVMQTYTQVIVQWQDLTITEDPSTSLLPDPAVEDEDEVWPGEIIYTKQRHDGGYEQDLNWAWKPAKVGIVQTVKSRDRLATIRWFEDPNIQFLGPDLIPPSKTGKLSEGTEDVSLYDISSQPCLTRRRGDFVLVHPNAIDPQVIPAGLTGPDWFGEVIDLGLDGSIAVRLGAANPVIDVRVPIESVTLAYSSDAADQMFNLDGGSVDSEEESDDPDFDSASFNEMWIEYEGMDGVGMEDGNEEDWSTEDEQEISDEDTSMPDAVTVDVRTTNTTPEMHSELEGKPQDTESTPSLTQQNPATDAPVAGENPTLASQPTAGEGAPASFLVLDTPPPPSHKYINETIRPSATFTRRVAKEHKILRTSLPPGIFVRTWESRLDLIRVLMIGPSDTPYEFAPFVIDFHLPSTYPAQPPLAFFHSWTEGNGPVNPNLYQDGKICLSLLGTWHADERGESWSAGKSTLLQVLVSIMGLVLVKEPYYNEAGYDVHRSAPETKLNSSLYTERAYFRARGFIAHALTHEVLPFSQELQWLYRSREDGAPRLLERAIEAAEEVLVKSQSTGATEAEEQGENDGLRRISLGATVMLKRQVERLKEILKNGQTEA